MRSGFTLVEMAMVLVIVGLIIGGVLVGKVMILTSQLRTNISEIQSIQNATNAFKLKYNGVPGDLATTKNFFPSLVNGNGNGIVDTNGANLQFNIPNGEAYNAHQSLLMAGLIQLTYSQRVSGTGVQLYNGFNITGQNSKVLMTLGRDDSTAYGVSLINSVYILSWQGTDIYSAHPSYLSGQWGAISKTATEWMDQKIDDGKPGSGKFIALNEWNLGDYGSGRCVVTTNNYPATPAPTYNPNNNPTNYLCRVYIGY